jgi:hypothetical protein
LAVSNQTNNTGFYSPPELVQDVVGGNSLTTRLRRRLNQMRLIRWQFEPWLQDVIDYLQPGRMSFILKDLNPMWEASTQGGQKLFDSTAPNALEIWAMGHLGYSCSAATDWFKIALQPEQVMEVPGVRLWLEGCQTNLYAAFARSNFYSAMAEFFRDAGGMGTAVLYAEDDEETDVVHFSARHLRECYISRDKQGKVNTLFRLFWLTAREAFDTWGDKLSLTIQNNADKQPDLEYQFLHAVEERTDRESGKVDKLNKKYSSVYLEMMAGMDPLEEDGYDKFPYFVWTPQRNSAEMYGRSPAWRLMPDIKWINLLAKGTGQAVQLSVMPPVNAPYSMRGTIKLTPRGMNYWKRPGEKIEPIQMVRDFPAVDKYWDRKIKSIENAYHVDFFLMLQQLEGHQMTAYEISQRMGQMAAVMGAEEGSLDSEALEPAIDWMFANEMAEGRLPPPPQQLVQIMQQNNIEYKVDFCGPLAQAQKRYHQTMGNNQALVGVLNTAGSLAKIGAMSQAQDVLNHFDFAEIAVDQAEVDGISQKGIRDEDAVKQIEQQQAQQAAAQQQAAQQQQQAEAYNKAKDAPEEGSPAYKIMRDQEGKMSGIQGG